MLDLCRHVAVRDSGKPDGCLYPVPSPSTQLSSFAHRLSVSKYPCTPIPTEDMHFEAYLPFACATTCRLVRLPCRSRPNRFSLPRLLLPGFQRVDHSSPRRLSLRWQLGEFHRLDFHQRDQSLASLHGQSHESLRSLLKTGIRRQVFFDFFADLS